MYSPKHLAAKLGIELNTARMVRYILDLKLQSGIRHDCVLPHVPAEQCYCEHATQPYELFHSIKTRKLYMLNRLLGMHGVESIPSRKDSHSSFKGIEYVNTGDSYRTTIMYDFGRASWLVRSWGDVVESSKRFQCE